MTYSIGHTRPVAVPCEDDHRRQLLAAWNEARVAFMASRPADSTATDAARSLDADLRWLRMAGFGRLIGAATPLEVANGD